MASPGSPPIDEEIERNYKHNFIVNLTDGTLFWFGASFFAYRTILPVYIANLTDSKFAIALLSTIIATGWLVPQLFTANWVQRLPQKKYAPVVVGFWSERVPIFLLVGAAWLATISYPLALIASFICITWHIIGAGTIAVGWQDMLAKIFPVDRRGKFFGLTNFGGTATGVLGASTVAWLLKQYEFPISYTLAFAAGSVFILISWFFLRMTREPAVESSEAPVSNVDFLRRLPEIVRADCNFRRYLISQMVISGGGMAIGFLAVYAVQRWQLPDSQAGTYTVAMLIGQAISNLAFGWLADRKGHKLILELSTLATGIAVGMAAIAPAPGWFYIIFALNGVAAAGFMLSGIMIVFEFTSAETRPTYIGLYNTVIGVISAIMPMLAGWLANAYNYPLMFVVAFIIGLAGLGLLHFWVREPRHLIRDSQTVR